MENTKESVYIFSVPIYEIKKHILNRSIAKINCIIYKTNKIRKINKKIKKNIYHPYISDDEKHKNAHD